MRSLLNITNIMITIGNILINTISHHPQQNAKGKSCRLAMCERAPLCLYHELAAHCVDRGEQPVDVREVNVGGLQHRERAQTSTQEREDACLLFIARMGPSDSCMEATENTRQVEVEIRCVRHSWQTKKLGRSKSRI